MVRCMRSLVDRLLGGRSLERQGGVDGSDATARARLALEGLSIGDAFGERFFIGDDARALALIAGRVVPDGPWRWTDDTAMAIVVTEELTRHAGLDPDRLAHGFARRYLADPARGYGRGTHEVLGAIARGVPWPQANRLGFLDGSKGNGAAMRSAPIGAFFAGDNERIVEAARVSALPTHAHPDAIAGAIAVALAAGYASTAATNHRPSALLAFVVEHLPVGPIADGIRRASAMAGASPEQAAHALGSGARVLAEDTVPFALWCADRHLDAFEEALWATVSGLGDRDTTCAIVGGIVACAGTSDDLPAVWRARREAIPAARPATWASPLT